MPLSNRSGSDFSEIPVVSVITPVRNGAALLENHIRMVKAQTYPKVEHIIIDGGSSDNTVEILKSKNNEIDYWISEPDHGIYDAMNKGIDAATGRWLFFTGVDDSFLCPEILEQVFLKSNIGPATQLVGGSVIRSDGKLIKSRFGKLLYYKNTLPHQGVFYRRDIFDNYRYGGVKKGKRYIFFKISGDYHLNLFLFMKGARHQVLNITIMTCGHGKSMAGSFIGYREEIVIRHFFIGHSKSIIFDFFSIMRYLRQRMFKSKINRQNS